ncbi:MAG: pantoate--beta-alanine ligase [Thermoanaerobaculia bacterium]|nr:pantoate--beta-alanine ligase [Thermoanaerobaculia bacterium]
MKRANQPQELRNQVTAWRDEGARIGFVPTMGALHEGHLSLVRLARGRGAKVIVSVFVNPAQFGPKEDLGTYPRQLERDAELLAGAGCDLLFVPGVETIYPPGYDTWISVEGPSTGLEGDERPGHFRGVATVVYRLFQLVRPDFAVFGEKDAQQLAVVRQLVRDLELGIEIVAGETVREPDGLAMSSRNVYLDPDERRAAAVLHRALALAAEAVRRGERRSAEILRLVRAELESEPRVQIDYAAVVDADSFQSVETVSGRCVVPIAVRIGKTRLIDNLQLA